MAIDYEKLVNLDYTAHEHVKDFEEKLEHRGLRYASISLNESYDGEVPVVEVFAQDCATAESYTESYRLDDVTPEEFEEVMFDVWREAFRELEP